MPERDTSKPKVLFLCSGNSCRSQMAEGLLRSMAGDRFEVGSAGTAPQGVNPGAVAAMAEVGIDISAHRSESVEAYIGSGVGTVVTVCDRAASNCPNFPGKAEKMHWSFDDPAEAQGSEEERMAVFRRVRDEIAASIRNWLAS